MDSLEKEDEEWEKKKTFSGGICSTRKMSQCEFLLSVLHFSAIRNRRCFLISLLIILFSLAKCFLLILLSCREGLHSRMYFEFSFCCHWSWSETCAFFQMSLLPPVCVSKLCSFTALVCCFKARYLSLFYAS